MSFIAEHALSGSDAARLDHVDVLPLPPLTATMELPRRIDVHRIDALVAKLVELAEPTGRVIADAHCVEMIDLAALKAMERLTAEVSLRLADASVALAVTADVTGHERVAAACTPVAPFPEAA
ncbi:MAG: hypothetical protein AAGD33_09835 [Actinomycetota bacterium]